MIDFITSLVGPKFAKPLLFGLAALLLLGVGFGLSRCGSNAAQKQAEQTTASGEAVASAAAEAIEIIGNRTVTEADIDLAVGHVQEEIKNAPDPDTIRSTVIAGLCKQASHRNDPACAVR